MSGNPLKRLGTLGQSIWLDYIRRDLIDQRRAAAFDRGGWTAGDDLEPIHF